VEELFFLQNEVAPALWKGLLVSCRLIVPSAILGLVIGVFVGVLRVFGNPFVSALANTYVALFRGFPLVVQLFIWYFGLPHVGIYFSPYGASVIAFSLAAGPTTPSMSGGPSFPSRRARCWPPRPSAFQRSR